MSGAQKATHSHILNVQRKVRNLSKQLLINGEPQIQVCWVIIQNPLQGVEILTILKQIITHLYHEYVHLKILIQGVLL